MGNALSACPQELLWLWRGWCLFCGVLEIEVSWRGEKVNPPKAQSSSPFPCLPTYSFTDLACMALSPFFSLCFVFELLDENGMEEEKAVGIGIPPRLLLVGLFCVAT